MTSAVKRDVAPLRRSPARQALAAAIEHKAEVESRVSATMDTADRIQAAVRRAREDVEAAKATIETVKAASVAHLLDASQPAPTVTVREARQALEDAEADLVAVTAAAERSRREPEFAVISRMSADDKIKAAIADVFAESPTTRALVARYRRTAAEAAELRRLLETLFNRGALIGEDGMFREIETSSATEVAWRQAWEMLKTDADAPLPGMVRDDE